MQYILEKWTKEYFDKIDLSNVPTLHISEAEDNVIVTVDDEHDSELFFELIDEITFKGMTFDMDKITPFGAKLELIYDELIYQSHQRGSKE